MTICRHRRPESPEGGGAEPARPAAAASSLCASAKRVMESASTRTCRPVSRKYSATLLLVAAARARDSAAGSEVAATTTHFAQRASPRCPPTKSRTSRPRVPDQADDDHVRAIHRRGRAVASSALTCPPARTGESPRCVPPRTSVRSVFADRQPGGGNASPKAPRGIVGSSRRPRTRWRGACSHDLARGLPSPSAAP